MPAELRLCRANDHFQPGQEIRYLVDGGPPRSGVVDHELREDTRLRRLHALVLRDGSRIPPELILAERLTATPLRGWFPNGRVAYQTLDGRTAEGKVDHGLLDDGGHLRYVVLTDQTTIRRDHLGRDHSHGDADAAT